MKNKGYFFIYMLVYTSASFMEILIFIIVGIILMLLLFKMVKAFFKWTLVLVVLVIIAYFTNPSESIHRETLKAMLKSEKLKRVRNSAISVKDYQVFSLTKIDIKDRKHTVGIGAFGKVWYLLGIPAELHR